VSIPKPWQQGLSTHQESIEMTNFKEEMKLRSHNIMQSRSRGLPLVRMAKYQNDITKLEKQVQMLMEQLTVVAQQRDALDKTLRSIYEGAKER
jgi:hypothetical protein